MRILLTLAMLFATSAYAASINIDPKALNLDKPELQALCGTQAPPVCEPGTNPPGAWNGVCPGYANTRVLTLNWDAPKRLYTVDFGGFGITDAIVVRFTTGGFSTGGSLVSVSAAEYNGPPSTREAALSDLPCDFTDGLAGAGGAHSVASTNSVTFKFGLGAGTGFGYYPVLDLGRTYYLNLRNAAGATCSINNACNMFVDLVKPGGL